MDKGHLRTVHSTKRWGRTGKKKKIVGDYLQFNDFDPWSVKNETHLKLFHAKHPLCSFISFIYWTDQKAMLVDKFHTAEVVVT